MIELSLLLNEIYRKGLLSKLVWIISVGTVACTRQENRITKWRRTKMFIQQFKKKKKEREKLWWKKLKLRGRPTVGRKVGRTYAYRSFIQWGSVEKWRASLNGWKVLSFKTAELGHFVDHALSPRSPQSLSGRGNDNHYFFVSATAHRNGGSWKNFPPSALGKINAFYRVSGISSCFIRFCAQTRFTPAIILNCFQSFEAIRNRREVEYTRIILKSLIDFDLEIIGWKII